MEPRRSWLERTLFQRLQFSLRTLFVFSAIFALPIIVVAMLGTYFRDPKTAVSPLFLFFGVASVLFFAAMGHAVGSRTGTVIGVLISVGGWLTVIVLAIRSGDRLVAQIPLHIVAIVATVLGIAMAMRQSRSEPQAAALQSLERLAAVKKMLKSGQEARSDDTKTES